MRHFKSIVVLIACAGMSGMAMAKTEVTQRSGGKLPDGSAVEIYTLKERKMEVQVMNYGGYVLVHQGAGSHGQGCGCGAGIR